MAFDSWRPTSSARSSRSSSPPGSTRTPSKTIVPRARRQPRSGTVTVDVATSSAARRAISARGPAHGDGGRRRSSRRRRCRRRAPRAPDRTRPGARAAAPADREIQTEVRSAPNRRLAPSQKISSPTQAAASPTGSARTRRAAREGRAAARRAGAAARARAPSGTCRRPTRRRPRRSSAPGREADRQHPDALVAPHQRHEQRRTCVRGAPRVRHLAIRVGDERRRRRARTRRRPSALRSAAGVHGSVGSASSPKPEVACISAVARIVFEEQRASAAGDVEGVLMQMRQQIAETGRPCCQRDERRRRTAAVGRGSRLEGRPVRRGVSGSRGIDARLREAGSGEAAARRFYAIDRLAPTA